MNDKALVVSDNCSACKELLSKLEQKGKLGDYRIINVDTPEGLEIAKKMGIEALPECLVIVKDKDEEKARVCTDEETKEILEG